MDSTARRASGVATALLLVGLAGCAGKQAPIAAPAAPSPPATAPESTAPALPPSTPDVPRSEPAAATACAGPCTPVHQLTADLRALFDQPALASAVWAVLVEPLATGETWFAINPDTLVVPASNEKIVTMATAVARLGWDFRYETRLESAAPVVNGVLTGDLVVVGGGDPTINKWSGDPDAVFAEFARSLEAAGIKRVRGRLIGDDNAFEDERFGYGWSWDDFAYGYAAPVGALQYFENLVEVVVRPGGSPGLPAIIDLRPGGSDLIVVNRVTTGAAGTAADVDIGRFPGRRELEVRGTIPAGSREIVRTAAVDNPTLYFVQALKAALVARGITVAGAAVDGDDVSYGAPAPGPTRSTAGDQRVDGGTSRRVLARHWSAPLSELGKTLMKASQNLYAETVQKSLSLSPGPASTAASRTLQAETLSTWGIAPGEYVIADGSGLSRLNFVSPRMLVRILRAMASDAASTAAFEATLPIAGYDGTIANRMKMSRAEGNVKAKTGTLTSVRALSGYLDTADGERVVFSVICNNFTTPTATVDAVVDQAMARLASFTRR